MALSVLFILFPGIIALAVANRLSGRGSRPVNEAIIELALHSALVVFAYSILSLIPYLSLPQPSELLRLTLPVLAGHPNDGEISALLGKANGTLVAAFLIALILGVLTALEREKKWIRWAGVRLGGIFQHDAIETAWHDAFAKAGPESWIHVDTKDGRRFTGLIYAASWDSEKGGICLKKVHIWDEGAGKTKPVADWIYLRTEDIDGPILFTKPIREEGG